MALYFFRLLASLTILDFSLREWSMDGTAQTFTFATNKRDDDVQISWILYNGKTNVTYFQCSPRYGINCIPLEDAIKSFFSANITSNSASFISMLTIKNVNLSLHNTHWFCSVDFLTNFAVTAIFELHVFAPAESPTCAESILINGSNIQVNCGTKRVFPESMCLFVVKTNISSEYELKEGNISYIQAQNLTTLYYKTTCTLVVSAAILGPGSHMFRVVMYPNINSNISEEMKMISEYTSSIDLAYPRAGLGTDCDVKGYIKENTHSNCTCYDYSVSFLPTKINWLTSRSILTNKGTLFFTAKRTESFQCVISNHLNWTDTIDFQPKISYPPDTLTVNMTKQVFDLCKEKNIFISGTCFVTESNPEPSITVNISNSLLDITSLKSNGEYVFNITMASSGIYYVSCLAKNVEYSINASSVSRTITIKGPPDIPTIFTNKNGEKKTQSNTLLLVTRGDTITCQSKGGYPTLRNILLACGHKETLATNQDQVSMTLPMSNATSGKCECIVWHDSDCLQNTSSIQFQYITRDNEESTTFELSDGAISGIVIAGILVSASLVFIIFLFRRFKGKSFKKSRRKNQNERHDYNHMSATTHYINTEIDQHETADKKQTYSNEDSITDLANGGNHHEYDTVNVQAEYCYDEIPDINVAITSGSS